MVIIVAEILVIGHRPTVFWEAGSTSVLRWAFKKLVAFAILLNRAFSCTVRGVERFHVMFRASFQKLEAAGSSETLVLFLTIVIT